MFFERLFWPRLKRAGKMLILEEYVEVFRCFDF